MRHSTIVLTMDTYGHLFPGQEADTVARLPDMLAVEPAALQATGTDDQAALSATQRAAHCAARRGREPANFGERRRGRRNGIA